MSYISNLLGADEKILFESRKHIFVLLGRLFKEILILAVLIAGWFVIYGRPEFFWVQIVIGVLVAVVLVFVFIDWLRWNKEAFYITNRRVIHTTGVFNKKVLDSSISKINDVIMEQSFLGRMFDYGTIKILTATEEVINRVDNIASPVELKKAMMGAKANLEPINPAQVAAFQGTPTQLLEELEQLKAKQLISEEEYKVKRQEILKRM